MTVREQDSNQTESGWYVHKPTGAVVELINDPELGSPLTNAYIKAGWSFFGETKPTKAELGRFTGQLDESDELASLRARAEAAEAEAARLREQSDAPVPQGKPLTEYKVNELVEIAKEVGVEDAERFSAVGTKKQDVIDAIEAAQEAKETE